MSPAPRLVLGPLLRHAEGDAATVWVEVDRPCTVEVLGHSARTFAVHARKGSDPFLAERDARKGSDPFLARHYGLVVVRGLRPGEATPYEVALDGERVWPLPGAPPSVVRTAAPGEPVRVAFGSCRVADAHEPLYGPDALVAFARRASRRPAEALPHALLLIGDQLYADMASKPTRDFIARRRNPFAGAGTSLADFEEYAHEYRVAWSHPSIRWLLSTVPTAMIFDDHDLHDDWNTSAAWVSAMRRKSWWRERVIGAFASYWVYQHLGNLSPEELARDPLYADVLAHADDASEVLRAHAARAEADPQSTRWSFARQVGNARVVALDSRAGRIVTPGARAMLGEDDWGWVSGQLTGEGADHLLVVSSVPWLLTRGMHHVETWNEAVADGAWGAWAAERAERLRQAFSFEHWGAFRRSFDRLAGELAAAGSGRRGPAPASICVLAGDVHHGYVCEVAWPRADGVQSAVWQLVCSPFRHPLQRKHHALLTVGASRLMHAGARIASRLAGAGDPPVRWRLVHRRFVWDNQIATLTLDGRSGHAVLERVLGENGALAPAISVRLS